MMGPVPGTLMNRRSSAGFVMSKLVKNQCIVNFVTNVLAILTIIACVSSHATSLYAYRMPLSSSSRCLFHASPFLGLNTCVGKANYTYFFRTMVSITTMLIVHSGVQLALVLDIYLGNGMSKTKSEDWFRADATIAVVVVMSVFLLLDFIALSLILQLLLFHTRLRKEGLTTYQFIVRDNRRKREQTVMENEIREQRLVAMAKATEEGRTCDKLQLCVGGYSRKYIGITCCDPLESEARAEDGTMNGNVASDSASNGAE